MDPIDEFHDRLTLFSVSMVAHMARILDRHGLMDDETRRLIHANLRLLSESAENCRDDDTSAEMVDLLVSILPAGKP
jgi:hypothetical protein